MRALHIAALQKVALLFSGLGTETFYLILLPLVYWVWNRRIGARLGILLLVSVMVNDLFKLAFHLPRPFWVDASLVVPSAAQEWSFGFPSGHAQAAFMVWPYLALRATRKTLFLSLAFVLAACIALSRLVLGVHWPLDVVGGTLIGLGILAFYEQLGASLEQNFRGRSLVVQMSLAVGFVLVCGAIGSFFIERDAQQLAQMDIYRARLQPQVIADGAATVGSSAHVAINALADAQASVVARCAALLGLVVGLMFAPVGVAAGGNSRQITLRLLIGLVGVAFFYIALKKILPDVMVFRFVRYFLTTFWVAGASLWVFRALGLAATRDALPVVPQPQQ